MTHGRVGRSLPPVTVVLALATVLAACGGGQPSPTTTNTVSAQPSGASPAPGASVAEAPTASPATAAGLPVGGFAEVVVDGLQLRAAPGTESAVVEGVEIALGEAAYIAERPVAAGDYAWYHVQLVDAFGWVAGGLGEEAYLRPMDAACPAAFTTVAELEGLHPAVPLVCFGATPLTVSGFVPQVSGLGGDCACVAAPEWLADPFGFQLLESQEVDAWRGEPYGLKVRIDPASGLSLPAPGQWVRVTGHYEDAAAATCTLERAEGAPGGEYDPVHVVLSCREQFVLNAVEPISTP